MANENANGEAGDRQVILQKIFVQDVSLEVPNAPTVFTREYEPEIDVQLNNSVYALDDDTHQVVLTVTVTAKQDNSTSFLVEVHQAGIFTVSGFEGEERDAVLGAYCPSLIFPYAREAISDLVQRGGFPQLLLQPVNFDALYYEHKNGSDQPAAEDGAPAAH